jgi:hypothetical protein
MESLPTTAAKILTTCGFPTRTPTPTPAPTPTPRLALPLRYLQFFRRTRIEFCVLGAEQMESLLHNWRKNSANLSSSHAYSDIDSCTNPEAKACSTVEIFTIFPAELALGE